MALSTVTAATLTVDQVQRMLVLPLQAASIFLSSGVRIFDVTAAGPVHIPTLTGSDAPSWVAENALIPEVNQTFDEIVLLDGTVGLKSISRFSNEIVRSSIINVESVVQQRLVNDVATKLDQALIAGDGANDTPLGLLNYVGTQEILVGGPLTVDHLHDAVGLALAANVNTSGLVWWMTPWTFTALSKVKVTGGAYLVNPDPTQAGAMRLLGHRVIVTPRIPTGAGAGKPTTVVLADMSTVAVARDMAPSVTLLRERYAEYDQSAIRVVARYDAAPLYPQAIIKIGTVTGGV